mmetsp:Transcript_12598/g.24675  ORF Transcript_12598/g.24675 Transcript_12598/m.24675 type:complete len:200 (-) Transcript_12598:60-659(-)
MEPLSCHLGVVLAPSPSGGHSLYSASRISDPCQLQADELFRQCSHAALRERRAKQNLHGCLNGKKSLWAEASEPWPPRAFQPQLRPSVNYTDAAQLQHPRISRPASELYRPPASHSLSRGQSKTLHVLLWSQWLPGAHAQQEEIHPFVLFLDFQAQTQPFVLPHPAETPLHRESWTERFQQSFPSPQKGVVLWQTLCAM